MRSIPKKLENYINGFTLIELLIALTIFSILATITSGAMYHAFNAKNHINAQTDRLNQIQLAVSLLQKDINQTLNRGILSNEMKLFPAFEGTKHYLEFSRDGIENPLGQAKRSTLKRVALVCTGERLVRRSWAVLDPVDHDTYEDKLLLDNLTGCHMKYLNKNLQLLSEWNSNAVEQSPEIEPFPKAIQLNVNLKEWGEAHFLFILPKGLYS